MKFKSEGGMRATKSGVQMSLKLVLLLDIFPSLCDKAPVAHDSV
jgi:hypothetical protein